MIIALAQVNPLVGDIAGNARKIKSHLDRARHEKNIDFVVFPELAIPGYPPKDLLLKSSFIEANLRAVGEIARSTAGGPAAVVGFVQRNAQPVGRPLFNALAVLRDGRMVGEYHKMLLPTYDVFDEHRYFEPGGHAQTCTIHAGQRPVTVGLTICEDLWNDPRCFERPLYHRQPIEEFECLKPEVVVNISASPFAMNKQDFRETLMSGQAAQIGAPIVLVNQVGANDELIFDGASFVMDGRGRRVARARSFEEDWLVVDLGRLGEARDESYPEGLASVHRGLVMGLREYVSKCGFREVVIGLSGGIDSALVAVLAVEALGPERVHGLAMPSRYSSDHSTRDAATLADNLGIDYRTLAIENVHTAMEKSLAPLFGDRPQDVTEENIQARIRGNLLMALSNKFGWLLLTTGNKSELAVGYCTLYGDMSGGLAVISDVPKTMVYALARRVNDEAGRAVIPESIINKAPSAELRPDQHDQQTLPEYHVLDAILHAYIENEASADEIIDLGYDEETVRQVIRMVDGNEYKRKQMPTGLKVTSRAFGVGRRMPIAAKFPTVPPHSTE